MTSLLKSKILRLVIAISTVLLIHFLLLHSSKVNRSILLFSQPGLEYDESLNQQGSSQVLFTSEDFVKYKFLTNLRNVESNASLVKENHLYITRDSLEFKHNLKFFRDGLVMSKYKSILQELTDLSENEILTNKWFHFSGNLIYLAQYGIHLMVSRIIYSEVGEKDKPKVSFVGIKAYDVNFKEIKGPKTFKYTKKMKDNHQKVIETEHLVTLSFPNIANINFDHTIEKSFLGPEDPKISLDKHGLPIVTFNMFDENIKCRRLYSFDLFNNHLVLLKIKGKVLLGTEKNWLPFNMDQYAKKQQPGQNIIRYIYSFDPLHVLDCNLDDGLCDVINLSGEEKHEVQHQSFAKRPHLRKTSQINKVTKRLGGGTSLFKVPESLTKDFKYQNANVWVLFSRSHIKKCGCGKVFYRPNIVILLERNNIYELLSISSSLGFNFIVKNYDDNSSNSCGGKKSVLLVNGISRWETSGQEDTMTILLTQADFNTEVIQIKGFKGYIKSILNEILSEGSSSNHPNNQGYSEQDLNTFNTRIILTALEDATTYCKKYSIKHLG